jgi:Icc-related predicted phosphoesterase
MDITAISDLHGEYPELEGGDLLIVAGDVTSDGSTYSLQHFIKWIHDQKYKKKVFIAGNHDNCLVKPFGDMEHSIEYLCDSGIEFEGLKIWGSPWTRSFEGMNAHCKAFTLETEQELYDKWDLIPEDTDILITHSPAYGILDANKSGQNVGSKSLYNVLKFHLKPKLHVFAHIHESYGHVDYSGFDYPMISVNASHMNGDYEAVNKPIRIIL